MNNKQHAANGEENGSSDQSACYAHPGVQQFLQPPSTSQTEDVEMQGDDRPQHSQNARNTKEMFPRQSVKMHLSTDERRFLLAVQRGDIRATERLIDAGLVDKNCVDPMGRTALVLAIINEDLPMVKLLISLGVEVQDALFHAISEEFVEAVELLLDHEEMVIAGGQQHSWESLEQESRSFSSYITPLILAAHHNHFEIVRMLLDRGATLPVPHDVRCGCCECVTSRTRDTVHHSHSRMNAFRALASPSLICLTARDPILSAFQLSRELKRLSSEEHEFRSEYKELKNKCKSFATALLDHTQSSHELETILNYDPLESVIYNEGRMRLRRLRLAVKLHQNEFVTHPNVQQLLASIWYDGLPGFRRKNMFLQVFKVVRIAVSFPFFSLIYIMAPKSSYGQTLKKPFIKFICHSASYLTFLAILIWPSPKKVDGRPEQAPPTVPEYLIVAWLCGMIKLEVRRILGEENLKEYVKDMWKVMDLGTTCLYVIVVILRLLAYFEVSSSCLTDVTANPYRFFTVSVWDVAVTCTKNTQCCDPEVDAMVLSKCLLALANIFSCLRMIYIFSVSPYLGPMQVFLSRMVTDMVRFFLLFMLVLFAFSCGLNQLLRSYSAKETEKCCETNITAANEIENCLNATSATILNLTSSDDDCEIKMRFASLFGTMQTLFWTVFGVIDMKQFNLSNIESFTNFSAKTILGTYTVIANVVLLNLLIAMLNNSYQLIFGKEDVEWKFARSKLWISYFDDKCTLPPPFNIFPTSKFLLRLGTFSRCCLCYKSLFISKCCSCDSTPTVTSEPDELGKELLKEQESRYEEVMHHLVRRYIMKTQQSAEHSSVSEDDINELKQDISAFRCELIDILQQSGYSVNAFCNAGLGGRKTRQRERRMMKDFYVNTTHANLAGLWSGQPSHLQRVLMSATAPVLRAGSKPATSLSSSAIATLKEKRNKFFSALQKNKGSPNKQIPRVGNVPAQSSSLLKQETRPFEQGQSQRQIGMVKGTMSESTTNVRVTTQSSDTFDASVMSEEELVPPFADKEDL